MAVTPGSSPRVRSRPTHWEMIAMAYRIISACAEQTSPPTSLAMMFGDHLRVCGADDAMRVARERGEGSSPRVRSRPAYDALGVGFGGIISACAEQTAASTEDNGAGRDHLRVCGADQRSGLQFVAVTGSSPRVRSRRKFSQESMALPGIISACAEQTDTAGLSPYRRRDHLRVCGADGAAQYALEHHGGSSPRVRSRRHGGCDAARRIGIISACAEQTISPSGLCWNTWDHLRVCGADHYSPLMSTVMFGSSPRVRSRRLLTNEARWNGGDHLRVCGADSRCNYPRGTLPGSSPRVRSRLVAGVFLDVEGGIISACAEQTRRVALILPPRWDHLRVCGADAANGANAVSHFGSSPRVRSRHAYVQYSVEERGIISACAEQTRAQRAGDR